LAKIDLVVWKDKIGEELDKISVDIYPYGYSVGPKGQWEMLIAAENKIVKANELTYIKVREITIPERAIVLPCFFSRHALGTVEKAVGVGVPKKAEEKRYIDTVIFHPIFNGEIHTGELLDVINIFYATFERKLNADVLDRWLKSKTG